MSQPVSDLPSGVQNAEGSAATAKVTANTRVLTANAPVGIMTDVMQFPGTFLTGNWVKGATRVLVMGVPVIHQSSTGISLAPAIPASGAMKVVQGNARVNAV